MIEPVRKLVVPFVILMVLAAVTSACLFADVGPAGSVTPETAAPEGGSTEGQDGPAQLPAATISPAAPTASVGPTASAVSVSSTAATVAVSPTATTETLGSTFEVAIRIEGAENLGGYHVDLTYDPAVVDVVDVEDGGFIVQEGQNVTAMGPLHPVTGTVSFNAWSTPPADAGVDGTGTLAVVRLEALGVGTSGLHLSDMDLYLIGVEAATSPDRTEDGTVEVVAGGG